MSLIKDTWKIVEEFVEDPKYVTIISENFDSIAEEIKKSLKDEPCFFGEPQIPLPDDAFKLVQRIIVYDLITSSINYQYWYGKYDVRPNEACALQMDNLLTESFNEYDCYEFPVVIIDSFASKLILNRFPNLEKRITHLKELSGGSLDSYIYQMAIAIIENKELNIDYWLSELIKRFPGFAGDLFLKRAFLFFIQLYRRMGWFGDEIRKVPVPMDYQLPKMLRWMDCISYGAELDDHVKNQKLIPENSLMECELRANCMWICRELAKKAECTMADIDTYLWENRKSCKDPFHLTITTNY